jgi:hypothetical protein
MQDAGSLFVKAAEYVAARQPNGLSELLASVAARPCENSRLTANAELPALARQEHHRFGWGKGREGAVDLIHSEGRPLQLILSLSYPRRRWFSPQAKDWKRITTSAEARFGTGQRIAVAGKESLHFRSEGLCALVTRYENSREAVLELKLAADRFYS